MARMKLETKLETHRLLGEGFCPSDIARELKIKPNAVSFQAKLLVEDGRLERETYSPAHYCLPKPKSVSSKPVGDFEFDFPQTCVFKKFGGSFKQVGRPHDPKHPYGENGKMIIEVKDAWKVEFGRYATKIWLFSFVGKTLAEQRINGERTIRNLGNHYAHKYHITLTFDRLYEDMEVLVASPDLSAKIADAEGLSWGEKKIVKGAEHKAGDSSDPDNMQFNAIPKGEPQKPQEHGKIVEDVFGGDYENRIAQLEKRETKSLEREERAMEREERVMKLLEKFGEDNEKTTEILSAIQQRMDIESERRKR